MDSRPILKKRTKLGILIDSKSFDKLLSEGDDANVETLLKYFRSDPFEFVRSPFDTSHDELEKVSEFIKKYDDKGNLSAIETVINKYYFPYQMQNIEEIGKFKHIEKEAIVLTYIQALLNSPHDMNILITDDETLLKNRLWLESKVSGLPQGCYLNIVSVEGAKEIMDLFSKYQNKYYISRKHSCTEGTWYGLSFLSKVPNFPVGNVGDPFLYAFSSRFIYLLMSLDEMGFQYYLGANNDTLNKIFYHFNYFISLMTGIFDSLAIITKKQYGLTFEGDNMESKISINPKTGKAFVKALKKSKRNPDLYEHINKYIAFMTLIYPLRNEIIHREMLPKKAPAFIGSNEKWVANFFKIDHDIIELLRLCNDRTQEYEPITQWGRYKSHTDIFLEPFHFAKSATKILITFSNKYLELLDILFSWDSVPGDDDEKIKEFLMADFDIGWAENSEILKSDDGKTISIFKDEKSAEIIIDEKKEKATLKITDGIIHELKVKKESGKLNIYKNKNKDEDSVGRIDVFKKDNLGF